MGKAGGFRLSARQFLSIPALFQPFQLHQSAQQAEEDNNSSNAFLHTVGRNIWWMDGWMDGWMDAMTGIMKLGQGTWQQRVEV